MSKMLTIVQGTIKLTTIQDRFLDVCQPESFQRKADFSKKS